MPLSEGSRAQSLSNTTNNNNNVDRIKIEFSAQKKQIPVPCIRPKNALGNAQHTTKKQKQKHSQAQVVKILGKSMRRRPPKTNVGRKRKVQQLAHAHSPTDRAGGKQQTTSHRRVERAVAATDGEKMQLEDAGFGRAATRYRRRFAVAARGVKTTRKLNHVCLLLFFVFAFWHLPFSWKIWSQPLTLSSAVAWSLAWLLHCLSEI